MKRRRGGLLFREDELKISGLLETAFLVEASPFGSLLSATVSVGLCLKASGLGGAEALEFGGAEAIELIDFSGRHGVEDGAAIDEATICDARVAASDGCVVDCKSVGQRR